jgi:hypothetical protein
MPADSDRLAIEAAVDRLHQELGHKRLGKLWAKLEIFLGLLTASAGLLVGVRTVTRPADISIEFVAASLILTALGGYLALAGNRSHLYQSSNRLAAYLAETIRNSRKAS